MENHNLEELYNKVSDLCLKINDVEYQIKRINSLIKSEGGTWSREVDRIQECLKEFRLMLTDPRDGIILKLDRLTNEALERKSMKQNIVGLWIAVAIVIIKWIVDYFTKH